MGTWSWSWYQESPTEPVSHKEFSSMRELRSDIDSDDDKSNFADDTL